MAALSTRALARAVRVAATGALVGGLAMVGTLGSAAWATTTNHSPTVTQTFHAHGADAFGMDELDLNPNSASPPPPGISLPSNCWLGQDNGIISTYGNGIFHDTMNKTGDWFTTTYTGDAAVYPLVEDSNGVPAFDPNTMNDIVDSSGTPLATGHLTQWFGSEDNNKNGVQHATVHFNGTDKDGHPVSLFGHFQFAINAHGDPTAMSGAITC